MAKKLFVQGIILAAFLIFIQCKKENSNPITPPVATSNIAMTKLQIATFFGKTADSLKGKLVYVKATGNCHAYFVDFSLDSLYEQKLCTLASIESPLISPDGGFATFHVGAKIYICALALNAVPVEIAAGYDPHWWVDPGGGGYSIVYCTVTGTSLMWPNPGNTWLQPVSFVPIAAAGTPALLAPYSLNGGLSKSGRYLATAYQSTGIYDRTMQVWKSAIGALPQACNASISPSTDPSLEPRIMYLTLGGMIQGKFYNQHEVIVISDTVTSNPDLNVKKLITLNPGVTEWQKPEWSTHPNYAVATGKKDNWDIYLLNLVTDDKKKIVDGDGSASFDVYPHLWIPSTY